jgi:hypothetical protein
MQAETAQCVNDCVMAGDQGHRSGPQRNKTAGIPQLGQHASHAKCQAGFVGTAKNQPVPVPRGDFGVSQSLGGDGNVGYGDASRQGQENVPAGFDRVYCGINAIDFIPRYKRAAVYTAATV